MSRVKKIIILGGGTAGWLVAAKLSKKKLFEEEGFISVIEPSDISTIGVGEGTWPTMRQTLKSIGISEKDFISNCCASLKQGSSFINWKFDDGRKHQYYHPFVLPEGFLANNPATHWQSYYSQFINFASSFTAQAEVCNQNLAPKQLQTPEYAAVLNYGYHFDANKLINFLRNHCTNNLGVKLIQDKVVDSILESNGNVSSVITENHGVIEGDLFIDCTGFHSVIFDDVYCVPKKSVSDILFNDSAWVAQVPYTLAQADIESVTKATALSSGWVWDISLQDRKGTGYVFSSRHQDSQKALEEFKKYHINNLRVSDVDQLNYREIKFQSAYRTEFWKKNCIAIGLSGGFVEPLEATAIALVEKNINFLCDHMPLNTEIVDTIRKRYNRSATLYWERAVEFIKLHYVLSERKESAYWTDHRKLETYPDGLQEKLGVWRYQEASRHDLVAYDEFFTSASYQYILSGMDFYLDKVNHCSEYQKTCEYSYQEIKKKKVELVKHLPTNEDFLKAYKE